MSSVGRLGVDASGNAGFDIIGGHSGLALAALVIGDARSALYSVQLESGAATPFGSTDAIDPAGTSPAVGLALALQ